MCIKHSILGTFPKFCEKESTGKSLGWDLNLDLFNARDVLQLEHQASLVARGSLNPMF